MKTLEEIKKALRDKTWIGYIWHFSDQNIKKEEGIPTIYLEKTIVLEDDLKNIQEMYLYDGQSTAIHCRYLGNAEPLFFMNTWSEFEDKDQYNIGQTKTYPSHLQKFGIRTVTYKTIYKKTPSVLGNAFTWEPVLEFFMGLEK